MLKFAAAPPYSNTLWSAQYFSFRFKTAFHSVPVVNPETLPISTMELCMTFRNNLQPLTIVIKISAVLSS